MYRLSLCAAMVSIDVDVSQLSNAELGAMLRKHGADCGPVVGKLALVVRQWLSLW